MIVKQFITASVLLLLSQAAIASDNEEAEHLFKIYCDVCHGMTGGMNMAKRVAPPIAAVRMHYIGRHPDKKSFIKAISGWVAKQDPGKSLMRGAIRRFNIMPPVPVSKEHAMKIADYIYEGKLQQPAGMQEHVRQQHKNQPLN